MTGFQELQALFVAYDDAQNIYEREAIGFADRFNNGFATHLDCQDSYVDLRSDQRVQYVQPMKVISYEDEADDYALPNSPSELFTHEDDGYLRYALQLTLERPGSRHSQLYLRYQVKFHLGYDECSIKLLISDNWAEFTAKTSEPDTYKPVYEKMILVAKEVLETRPWNTIKKVPMGFESSRGRSE